MQISGGEAKGTASLCQGPGACVFCMLGSSMEASVLGVESRREKVVGDEVRGARGNLITMVAIHEQDSAAVSLGLVVQ